MDNILPSTKILGTIVTTASKKDVLEYIVNKVQKGFEKLYIVTPNPEILVYATRSKEFQRILNNATVSLPDGIGVIAACNILKKPIKERISGVDMMLALCSKSANGGFKIGLLGGREGVAEKTSKCLREKYPDLIVNFVDNEWGEDGFKNAQKYDVSSIKYQEKKILRNTKYVIPNTHIDMLFVAFGFPKQEEWIAENLPNIDVTLAMGVGGAFDYISGKVPRAPKFVRNIGMEWAFRLVRQPWRIKRQLILPVFVGKVIKSRFA